MSKEEDTATTVNHDVLYPAVTGDYRLSTGDVGLGIAANRRIEKGNMIMEDSFEFMFCDIQDGDRLWLNKSEEASKLEGGKDLPTHIPLTREMLLRTHGVPVIQPQLSSAEEVVVRWQLETPGMLINHSCDPNVVVDSHDCAKGEDYATRDIEVGEELRFDYVTQYYDRGPFFEKCLCGAASCRGSMMGFKGLTDAEKEELLPKVSEAVKAMHLADIGKGPKVREDIVAVRPRSIRMPTPTSQTGENMKVVRFVFPGPSAGLANVIVKKCENTDSVDEQGNHTYELYASKDVTKGELFYEFWQQEWPHGGEALVDMAFSSKLLEEDPAEGTLIRFDPNKCGAYRDSEGELMFSGWQLLTTHSCDPNTVYCNDEKDEDEDWQSVFAAKNIKKGDRITMDWNCFNWDRGECDNMVCDCGATNCTGTKQGFKYLSPEAQNERRLMTWLHETPSADSSILVRALSPYVRETWLKVGCPDDDVLCTKTSTQLLTSASSNEEK